MLAVKQQNPTRVPSLPRAVEQTKDRSEHEQVKQSFCKKGRFVDISDVVKNGILRNRRRTNTLELSSLELQIKGYISIYIYIRT